MQFVVAYERVISWIMWRAQFGPDKLVHTFAGLAIWLLVALVVRRGFARWLPFAAVVLAETGNEVMDYIVHINWTATGTLGDIVFTLFWPLVLTLALRWKR